MIALKNNDTIMEISGIKSFENLFGDNTFDISKIEELFVSGCTVDSFSFLDNMNNLNKLVFLACKGNNWNELHGKESVKILRLHNIKQNKDYIQNIDFISKFINLEYIYLNMLGIETFPDITKLDKLHTILSSNRKLYDYSSLEYAKALTTFIGWMATDNHRTPAESFLPILKNSNLTMFQYTQMFSVEDKKLDEYIKRYCPNILRPTDLIRNKITKLFF